MGNFKLSPSKIRCYTSCQKKYDFIYNEQLEPLEKAECLLQGGSYHEKVAKILKGEEYEKTNDKIDVMAEVFKKYILPKLPQIKDVEIHAEKDFGTFDLHGYIDAVTIDGIPVEHKTTSMPVDEFYTNRLNWDMQVPIYMILTEKRDCLYTVMQKPTIRQKQSETEEQFLQRCLEWYETDTKKKVGVFKIVRTEQELLDKSNEITMIAVEMQNKMFYFRNPSDCSIMGCPYSSICLDYDRAVMPIGFKKKENEREVFGND